MMAGGAIDRAAPTQMVSDAETEASLVSRLEEGGARWPAFSGAVAHKAEVIGAQCRGRVERRPRLGNGKISSSTIDRTVSAFGDGDMA
jgi:hypothetical protein